MSTVPILEQRPEQPYLAIPAKTTSEDFATAIDDGFPELLRWLDGRGIAPAGAPFIRYLVIDGGSEFQVDLAVPVAAGTPGDDRVRRGVLPSGRYATLLHVGSYGDLPRSYAAMDAWAAVEQVTWDTWETAAGTAWRGRVERYLTDPRQEPDPARWQTELAYLVG